MKMSSFVKMFFTRIKDDFQHKELFPLKILFFVHASTLLVLYPYLTIHMRELGISVEETAIMSAVTPVVAIIMPPIAGMFADKIGNFKILLAIFSSMGGAASLLLLTVPIGRLQINFPDRVILDSGCTGVDQIDVDGIGFVELGLAEDIPCDPTDYLQTLQDTASSIKLDTRLEACGFICQNFKPADLLEQRNSTKDTILTARSYAIKVHNLNTKNEITFHYNLTQEEVPKQRTKMDALSHRFIKHSPFYTSSIRKLSNHHYFFPATGMYNLTCRKTQTHDEINAGISSFLPPSRGFRLRRGTGNVTKDTETEVYPSDSYNCYFGNPDIDAAADTFMPMFRNNYTSIVTKGNFKDGNFSMDNRFRLSAMHWINENDPSVKNSMNLTCMDTYTQKNEEVSATVNLHDPNNNEEVTESLELGKCHSRCLYTVPRKQICKNTQKQIIYDPQYTFWCYLVIRVFIGIIGGTAYSMFEGAVIAILREQKADYGLQRIYASIGGMISSPLSGLLIEYASRGKGYTDFRPAFYLYAGLKIASGALMLTLNLEFKSGAKNVISDVMNVLKNIEIIALLVASFMLGIAWGYIESFLFWLLQDLGGSSSLMGITVTVGGIAGIPLLILSGPIINKIGHANVLFIGFIFYAIRLVGYSLIYNPWHCLIFEAMESITSSLAFTAIITYAAKLSTTTTDSSIQGLLGGLYFGVGKGAGSLIGGYMMKAIGTRPTYRVFAGATLGFGIAYFLLNHLYLRHRPNQMENDICKKEEKPKKTEYVDIDLKNINEKSKDNVTNGTVTSNEKVPDLKKIESQEGCDGEENPGFQKEEDEKGAKF